jgi:endonuclease-3
MAARKRSTRRKTAAKAKKKSRRRAPAYPTAKGAPRRSVPNDALPEIIEALQDEYPNAHCELNHEDAFQLLIATILSAQCTDVRVNKVTEELFEKYRGPEDYLAVPQEELEEDIRTTGFFRNKAKNIRKACQAIVEEHGGEVPRTMKELRALGGVGRKTANVVMGNVWNEPDGVVVDTHVARLSRKLGLTNQEGAEQIERELNEIVPQEHWTMFSHWLIWHGRRVCKARNPNCEECVLYAYCPTRA